MAPRKVDVAIVGGGIAGSALASVLASRGVEVAVLEREVVYRDRAAGEYLTPWGVAEARWLGVEDVLLAAGGGYIERVVGYDELLDPTVAESGAPPLGGLVPGVPGAISVGHPQACEALVEHAERAGAQVLRGVRDVDVVAGAQPSVSATVGQTRLTLSADLVVAADGRGSTVRRQVGIRLERTSPRTIAAGLLVEGLDGWPAEVAAIGTEDDVHFFVFPRPGGTARLAVMHDSRQRGRYATATRQRDLTDTFVRLRCVPDTTRFANARPAGPVISYPMTDAWTDRPGVEGVVLVGDAAGWSDPIIGQGLAIALRDARIVADLIWTGDRWSDEDLGLYAGERSERMRRLRVASYITTELRCTFTAEGRERRRRWFEERWSDPLLIGTTLAQVIGPEHVDAEAFSRSAVDRILGRPATLAH